MRHANDSPAASQGPIPDRIALGRCIRAADCASPSEVERVIIIFLLFQGWEVTEPQQHQIPLSSVGLSLLSRQGFLEMVAARDGLIRRRIVRRNGKLYYINRRYRQWLNEAGEPLFSESQLRYIETGIH
jgi:hypothetical protein